MVKKVRRSNVKDGVLLPLGNGFSLVKGDNPNKTDDVDIGPNNKNGLSVNHGEILQQKGNTLRVFSAEPMLGGVSPVQLLYGGMAPDKVFAMQEQYKDVHGINDDGSRQYAQFGIRKKFQGGGESKNEESKNEESKKRSAIAYGDKTSTRLRYLNLDKKLTAYINHVATQYGISPAVLASRLSSEGAVDKHIQYLDNNRDKKGESLLEHIYSSGFSDYGLDDTFTLYEKGKLNLRRKIPFRKSTFYNEKNRFVNSVDVHTPYDGIELMAANLEYFSKELKKKFPNLKDKDLDTAVTKAYNMGLYGAIKDISKNGVGNKYKINDGYYNINYNNDIYLQNKDKIYNVNMFTKEQQNDLLNHYKNIYIDNVNARRKHNSQSDYAVLYPTEDFQEEWAEKHAIKELNKGSTRYAYPIGTTDYTYNNPFANVNFSFKLGGQTNINPLGERPNAKYGKQMKNKRNKAERGGIQSIGSYNFPKSFIDKYGNTIGINGMISKLAVPSVNTGLANPPKINPIGNLTKGSGLSTTAMGAIGAGINTLGSLIGAGIQQGAINSLEAPQRQYTLLNPVKLKTKININPQIARMREMQAQLADAARRTSGSSRTAYQKMLAGHNRLLDSAMDLYGRKENIETELINRDRLNQQQVAHANATNVMNTVNYNNEAATEMRNRKRIATSNNWTTALNTTAGAWAGPNGFIDRANALRVKAGELYTQAIANPTAARLLYGDIDFTTGANKRKAFNTIYDFLNNNRFA